MARLCKVAVSYAWNYSFLQRFIGKLIYGEKDKKGVLLDGMHQVRRP